MYTVNSPPLDYKIVERSGWWWDEKGKEENTITVKNQSAF